jgi:hypothetical protein
MFPLPTVRGSAPLILARMTPTGTEPKRYAKRMRRKELTTQDSKNLLCCQHFHVVNFIDIQVDMGVQFKPSVDGIGGIDGTGM